MKITFIKDKKLNNFKKIRIFVRDSVGNDIQIDLQPGEFTYSENDFLTNSLRVYLKKGVIKIEDRTKPINLNNYVVYASESTPSKKISILEQIVEKKENILNSEKELSASEIKEIPDPETKLEQTKKAVKKYSSHKKKSKKGPGRPKKRGPKKGSKNKKRPIAE